MTSFFVSPAVLTRQLQTIEGLTQEQIASSYSHQKNLGSLLEQVVLAQQDIRTASKGLL